METIKPAVGISTLVVCMIIFAFIAYAKIFRKSKPAFFIDNIAEIAILTFVSMLMGIVLIFA